jgi:hypothetical protein
MSLLLKTAAWFQRRHGKMVVFLGNEYDLMDEKFAFLKKTGTEYICTQLPIETSRWLYGECTRAEVLAMPHALNPDIYCAKKKTERTVDLGFRGDAFPLFVGDTERTDFINGCRDRASVKGLRCDIQFCRVAGQEWASFLRSCRGVVGGESGTYYMDRRGAILGEAKKYLYKHPEATLEDLRDRFFMNPPEHRSGKCVSSRHFEAIGTKTCQVLLEGEYNGILQPGEHYIAVRSDMSNFNEAIQAFLDETYRRQIVERAYEHAMEAHTYAHRVRELIQKVTVA